MDATAFTPDELHFLQWMARPVELNKKKAKELIEDLQDNIIYFRSKLSLTHSRLEKNGLYIQIQNREQQIKHANTFL